VGLFEKRWMRSCDFLTRIFSHLIEFFNIYFCRVTGKEYLSEFREKSK
jgi:hypothetical protein